MLLLSKTVSRLSHNVFRVNRINLTRRLSQQQVTVPNQETLTGRILSYLNIDNGGPNSPQCASEIVTNLRENVNQLHKLSTNEIINFSSVLTDQRITRNERLLILRELDTECYLRLPELNPTDILKLLNVYINVTPGRVTDLKFYKHSIKILYESLQSLNKKDFLQLIFYVGLRKKTLESQTMLRQCMRIMDQNLIDNLTREELCIICNATFKSSTKIINKKLLVKVRDYINNNLSVLKDCALFVTFVKTLRHNRFQNDDLLTSISCATFFNKTHTFYSFPMICHVMALFADYFFYDEELFRMFAKQCVQQLSESSFVSKKLYLNEQLRGKDIKRFLWVMSMFSEMKLLGHSDVKNVIIPKLTERIRAGEFENDLDSLVDITLYLWMLNYHAEELVPYIFNERTSRLLTVNSKSNLRLNLLLYAISVENTDLLKKIPIRPFSIPSSDYSNYQLPKRPLIQRLLSNLQGIKNKLDLNKFELSQEIPHLNIVGITGFRNGKKAVYIEVLDDYTKIKNVGDDVPVGLMALKLRLLDKSEEGVLVVCQKETEEMTDADLNEYLLDEIKLIC